MLKQQKLHYRQHKETLMLCFSNYNKKNTWGADDGVSRMSGRLSPAWMRITSTMSFFVLKNTNNYLFFWFYYKTPKLPKINFSKLNSTGLIQMHTHLSFCSGKSPNLKRRLIPSKFCERKYLHGCRLMSEITDSRKWHKSREGRKDKELTDSDRKQSVQTLSTILHFWRL